MQFEQLAIAVLQSTHAVLAELKYLLLTQAPHVVVAVPATQVSQLAIILLQVSQEFVEVTNLLFPQVLQVVAPDVV